MALKYYPLNKKAYAETLLEKARDRSVDQCELDDIKSVYDLLDKPQEAMARIANILTGGGRVYDEFSEFLRGKDA
jgi:hypothetical protein